MQPRENCCLAFSYIHKESSFQGLIKNMTCKGAYIKTKKPLDLGQELTLCLPCRYMDPPSTFSGLVVWTGEKGMGVRFSTV